MFLHEGAVTVEGLQLHYSECGKGVPTIFVHGVGGCRHMFVHYLFPKLFRIGRLIALDLPGYENTPPLPHGNTVTAYSRVLIEALDRMGIARCHLVGVSMGGIVVLKIAAEHPERIISVCASGAVIYGKGTFSTWMRAALVVAFKPLTVFPYGFMNTVSKKLLARRWVVARIGKLTNPVDLQLLGDAYPDIAMRAISRSSPRVWAENILSVLKVDLRKDMKRMIVPVLVTDGEHVHLKTMRTAKNLAHYIPRQFRHVAIIPKAGHLAPYSNSKDFAAALRSFYNSLG